jgi:hypothetical protein
MLKLGIAWNEVQIGLPPLNKKHFLLAFPTKAKILCLDSL